MRGGPTDHRIPGTQKVFPFPLSFLKQLIRNQMDQGKHKCNEIVDFICTYF